MGKNNEGVPLSNKVRDVVPIVREKIDKKHKKAGDWFPCL